MVLDKQDYTGKGFKHLSVHETYSELGQGTSMEGATKVTSTVRASKNIAEYLLPPNPVTTQEMYVLTKIHTLKDLIYVWLHGPTERVSVYMDHRLQPLAQSLPSYIKDSKDFIKVIESTPLPRDCLLCTWCLHQHAHRGGINAVREALGSHRNLDQSHAPIDTTIVLLDLILYNNVFQVDDRFYLQLQGTAMGTKVAP